VTVVFRKILKQVVSVASVKRWRENPANARGVRAQNEIQFENLI
jgi:hypothetical protein